MKTQLLHLLALITGIVIFDFLYYQQSPGINMLLFSFLVILLVRLSGREIFSSNRSGIAAAGMLVAGLSGALYGSFLSFAAFFGAFLVFLGFSFEPALKSLLTASFHTGLNYIMAPFSLISEASGLFRLNKYMPGLLKFFKLLILPLVVLAVFITLFRFANPLFNRYFHELDSLLDHFLVWLKQYFVISHLLFLAVAGFVITGIVYRSERVARILPEKDKSDTLLRARKQRISHFLKPDRIIALKDEYRMGVILFWMLNVLLFIMNITELVWLNGEYRNLTAADMATNLHEGTNLLILSIILSIVVILIFFRRNLNFYPRSRLVGLASAWILQNMVLGISVILLNWFYISQYGLTYRRIGVYFFLVLVMAGLVFIRIKVRKKKTNWYLIKMNAWVFYFAFLVLSLVNWDYLIIRYNLRPSAPSVDYALILDLPERNIGYLLEYKEPLIKAVPDKSDFDSGMNERIKTFLNSQQEKDWQSMNVVSYKAQQYLRKHAASQDRPGNSH